MKIPKVLFAVFISLLLAAELYLASPLFRIAAASYTSGISGDPFVDSARELVRASVPAGNRLFFVSSGDRREESAEKAVLEAVSWEMLPAPVESGSFYEGRDADAIFMPSYAEDAGVDLPNAESGFRKAGEAAGRTLWVRDEISTSKRLPLPVRDEARGLLPFLALVGVTLVGSGFAGMAAAVTAFSLLLFVPVLSGWSPTGWFVWRTAVFSASFAWFFRNRGRTRPGLQALLLAVFLFAGMAFLALAHAYVAPYGLSITGGKAKLWYLAGGLDAALFSDPAWRFFEPAYPPGCATLTLGAYAAAGGCGDTLTQLLSCLCLALAAGFTMSRTEGLWRKFWLLGIFAAPVALMTASQFYPEPMMLVCLLAGWERIRDGKGDTTGWLLLGVSGWFKNEGLVFLFAAWMAWRIVGGSGQARIRDLLLGAVIPVAWQIGCRCYGAHLNGYALPWRLSAARGGQALAEIFRQSFFRPWNFAFAYPAALVVAVYAKIRRAALPRPFTAACFFAFFSLVAFSLIYACGGEIDLVWHLRTSLPRLLLTPAVLLVWECARFEPVA